MRRERSEPGHYHTVLAARETFAGRNVGIRRYLPFLGPAFIASVAYIDPGNFATNIQAGSRYNYDLLWVVLLASITAMLFQALSAKLGIVTGTNLAEQCRRRFGKTTVISMWIGSEIAAMATDLAEFIGGAIGLSLLAHIPLPLGMFITAIATFALLLLESRGFRPLEVVIGSLVGVIGMCYVVELAMQPPDWAAVALHSVVPHLAGMDALTLAVGIVGATIMPHAIYLHSGLTQRRIPLRNDKERETTLSFSNWEVVIALGIAGIINMAMLAMAAVAFHQGHPDVAQIQSAYRTLEPLFGSAAALVFLIALIASGISSSAVGTMAGQVIMQGFVGFHIPVWLRRVITMVPAICVVASGVNATEALVLSQVLLSLVLPVPMIALIVIAADGRVMGRYKSTLLTTVVASVACAFIIGLNAVLLVHLASSAFA